MLIPFCPYLTLPSAIQEDEAPRTAIQEDLLGALYARLHSAMTKREVFRVMILLPVHPEGNLDSTPVKTIMRCEYLSIYVLWSSFLPDGLRSFRVVFV